jgi:hypothetical protein
MSGPRKHASILAGEPLDEFTAMRIPGPSQDKYYGFAADGIIYFDLNIYSASKSEQKKEMLTNIQLSNHAVVIIADVDTINDPNIKNNQEYANLKNDLDKMEIKRKRIIIGYESKYNSTNNNLRADLIYELNKIKNNFNVKYVQQANVNQTQINQQKGEKKSRLKEFFHSIKFENIKSIIKPTIKPSIAPENRAGANMPVNKNDLDQIKRDVAKLVKESGGKSSWDHNMMVNEATARLRNIRRAADNSDLSTQPKNSAVYEVLVNLEKSLGGQSGNAAGKILKEFENTVKRGIDTKSSTQEKSDDPHLKF